MAYGWVDLHESGWNYGRADKLSGGLVCGRAWWADGRSWVGGLAGWRAGEFAGRFLEGGCGLGGCVGKRMSGVPVPYPLAHLSTYTPANPSPYPPSDSANYPPVNPYASPPAKPSSIRPQTPPPDRSQTRPLNCPQTRHTYTHPHIRQSVFPSILRSLLCLYVKRIIL